MFCCFQWPKTAEINTQNDEKQPILRSGTATINYQTIFRIPYAHVLRDDKIAIESSNIVDANTSNTYWLFNDVIPDPAYEKGTYHTSCFAFDDVNVSTPVVIATKTTNGHFLFERLFQINHVNAVNPSGAIRMRPTNHTKAMPSNTVSMARPFDEFLVDASESNSSLDVKSNGARTKSDKD
ncbi:unnamed protein product [Rotaria socialis]|uniref:Uncharacterized protein n=1 Tax=Rotaria socialis TaxID=392032 RepID=A0A820H5S7_9BILA|nr:unnamed protein product [Rotaria socialis]CAF4288202.1 unnamed protein product [Rotaria socialis]CAF4297271.1 unnamed protein product [Rotaria socialis]CAF4607302.1 unnamed protein product [Rotaria socialis]